MYTTTCLFHWPRNILLTQWTRIQREAYSISVRKHLCLVLILGNVGGCRCDSCLLLIKKVAGRVWIPDAARKRILIVAFDLAYWVLDFAPYIYCGANPEQVKYLWDVTPALWCNQCYLDNFVVHSAKGVFCHNVPYMPRVAIALSLDIEAKVKVIWNSLAAGQCLDPVIENYAKAPTAQYTQRYGSTRWDSNLNLAFEWQNVCSIRSLATSAEDPLFVSFPEEVHCRCSHPDGLCELVLGRHKSTPWPCHQYRQPSYLLAQKVRQTIALNSCSTQ